MYLIFKKVKLCLSQFALGRGELKLSKFALLFIIAGFLINISSISAQENAGEGSLFTDNASSDPHRIAEQGMRFGEEQAALPQGTGVDTWAIVRMVLVLVLAAAAVYGVVFLFKRASKQSPNNDPFLKILANTHLGQNRYAHIISAGSRAWLVGSSEGGVNLIDEIEDSDLINAMLLEESRRSAETRQGRFPDFMSLLRRAGVSAKMNAPGADEIRKRRERLKGL